MNRGIGSNNTGGDFADGRNGVASWTGENFGQLNATFNPVQENDRTFQQVQDMFQGKVEADVVYMVLSECNWKGNF